MAFEAVDPAMVGQSKAFLGLKSRLPTIARAQRTTLIVGPTGSGKDLIARALHRESERRDQPFVVVHCAALPESLIEGELFGHCRGAFTGATASRAGLIRTASGGTLFLDEIDSLSLSAQAKLLRFLESGEYRAVGSDHTETSSAWIIVATNQDLREHVRRRTFRADLLYRLEVVRIDVPPLRHREADILYLADYFLRRTSETDRRFSDDARRAMLMHEWPGNVRELKHRIEAAALLTEDPIIDSRALGLGVEPVAGPPELVEAQAPPEPLHPGDDALQRALDRLVALRWSLADAVGLCEKILIEAALRAERNNRTRAAERLNIHVRTIYKKGVTRRPEGKTG